LDIIQTKDKVVKILNKVGKRTDSI
jgi:hypothetical protein